MSRLPFDPAQMEQARRVAAEKSRAPQPAPSASAEPLTVSALAAAIARAVEVGVPARVQVSGEISNFRDRTHWYFDLKDAAAVISCVAFANVARRSRLARTLADGQSVIITGRVEFYEKAGKVSLIVDSLELAGAGPLDRLLRDRIEQLRTEGLLDPARKRPLPRLPRKLAVVTSRTSAALQDVLVTMKKRCSAVEILLADVRVQGDGAAAEIAAALADLSRRHRTLGIDAILLTRGGGSQEDLWCFNELEVAYAIARCALPVVAAIGHETDVTIAELVADERCATPTQAAMRLTPDAAALARQLDACASRLAAQLRRLVRHEHVELARAADRLAYAARARARSAHHTLASAELRLERQRPAAAHARLQARLSGLAARLTQAMHQRQPTADLDSHARRLTAALHHRLATTHAALAAADRQLRAVDPRSILDRGYSVTLGPDGRALRAASAAPPGTTLRTLLARGALTSIVQASDHLSPGTPAPRTPPPGAPPAPLPARPHSHPTKPSRRPPSARDPDSSAGLFG